MAHAILMNKSTVIKPPYELIADVTVTGATASNIDLTGLNITKDDIILMEVDVDGGNGAIAMYFNGNYTATNYYTQRFEVTSTTVTAGERANAPYVLYAQTRSKATAHIKLVESGHITWISNVARSYTNSGATMINDHVGTSTFTATSITSIRLSGTNLLGVGTRVQLFKLKADKVFDTTLSSAQTNIDIGSLAIEEDSEYLLISDVKNATTSTTSLYLMPNANYTATNYYRQYLTSNGVTNSTDRANVPTYFLMDNTLNMTHLAFTRIKLTNNGYFVFQTYGEGRLGTTTNLYNKTHGVSTFISTSITSLRISATVASSLAIGSRFILYKLR